MIASPVIEMQCRTLESNGITFATEKFTATCCADFLDLSCCKRSVSDSCLLLRAAMIVMNLVDTSSNRYLHFRFVTYLLLLLTIIKVSFARTGEERFQIFLFAN